MLSKSSVSKARRLSQPLCTENAVTTSSRWMGTPGDNILWSSHSTLGHSSKRKGKICSYKNLFITIHRSFICNSPKVEITQAISETFYWFVRGEKSFITFNLIKTESQHFSPRILNLNYSTQLFTNITWLLEATVISLYRLKCEQISFFYLG